MKYLKNLLNKGLKIILKKLKAFLKGFENLEIKVPQKQIVSLPFYLSHICNNFDISFILQFYDLNLFQNYLKKLNESKKIKKKFYKRPFINFTKYI